MTTTFDTLTGRAGFHAPRLTWRRLIGRVVALDALFRERAALVELDDRMLRDIGVNRADVAGALDRPRAHYALILRRGGHQF